MTYITECNILVNVRGREKQNLKTYEDIGKEKKMKRTNYYAVVLENGYLDNVYTSRADAEEVAFKINRGDYCGGGYTTYKAEVVRGLANIRRAAKYPYSVKELKDIAENGR